ncbi:hypothetical protein BRADI_2g03151v3 [Brachypodium distachyon]|uniref:Uncharacterized protein n=1 Tax=Brachypodium distachyon TaxID=15368 RepID=A0A0Q3FWW7_BRADI|nr:hypothetical protein BRADI_2g03151v3 [Brachypodium distachyon]
MQGRKRKASMSPSKQQTIGAEIQNKNVHGIKMIITRSYSLKNTTCDFSVIFCMYTGQYLRSENEMLRRQLACKTKELEAEMIRRLKVELDSKKKENKSLRKENEKLRDENEYYRKTAKPPRNRRLCRYCGEYVFHDYRNCPTRRACASSEDAEGNDCDLQLQAH